MYRNRIEIDIEKLLPTARLMNTEKFHRIQIRTSIYEILCELRQRYHLWDTEAVIIKLLENTAEQNEEIAKLMEESAERHSTMDLDVREKEVN